MSNKVHVSDIPSLMNEWDWSKNGEIGLFPNELLLGSNKKAWWKCDKNHSYMDYIYKKGNGKTCPYCTNKRILKGYNDLATVYPRLAQEWNYTRNQISINDVVLGSSKKVWWKCSKCGAEWMASIRSRTQRNSGCPQCSKQKRVQSRSETILNNHGSLNIPLLLEEWDYDANGELLPENVTNGSGQIVNWKCSKCGYKWKAKVSNRANGRGCPLCSNKVVVQGVNDLLTTHPDLAKEWDYQKNIELTPQNVTYGTNKKVYWLCPQGHSYQATVLHRSSGTNCPICNSGRQTSFAEQALFFYIKKCYSDAISRYTDIFDNGMELDIFIPSIKTAIEYDGIYWHRNNRNREEFKYQICQKHGIRLIRIKESKDIDCRGIADKVYHADNLDNKSVLNGLIIFFLQELDLLRMDRFTHPFDVNIFRDEFEIRHKYMTVLNSGSVQELRPNLAKEWCYEKNGDLTPSMFTLGSSQKVWWKCSVCGNIWKTSVNSRVKGSGCNVCYRKTNRGANHVEAKKVFQYTLDGVFIKAWDCISEASRKLKINSSNISMCAKHQRANAGGYIWEYFYKEKVELRKKIKRNRKGIWGKQVFQIDDSGNIINTFKSLNEAAKQLNIDASNISRVIHGHSKKAGGYFWKT